LLNIYELFMKYKVLNLKNALVSCALMFSSVVVIGQQDAQFSMYMFNPLTVNPAYAGSRDALSVSLIGKNQWVNINGAPTTATLSLHTPLRNEAVSVGLSVIQDEIGPTQTTGIYGDLAYRIKVSKNSSLAFGLKGGVDIFSADFGDLRVRDENDRQYFTPIQNEVMPNFGFGLYLNSDKYYIGLTVPKIVQNELEGGSVNGAQAYQARHLFLTAGRTFEINSVFDIVPSALVKLVENTRPTIDMNVNFMFYDKIWIGGGYRINDSFVGNLVYHFTPQFRVGYAYDYNTSELGEFNAGSHEIMLGYDLDFLGKGFKSPRRF